MDEKRFARVWQRVKAPVILPPAAEPPGLQALEALITAESRDRRTLDALSRRCAGGGRWLPAAAEEKSRRLRALQAEYFMRSGDSFAPVLPPEARGGTLSALRQAHKNAKSTAETYRNAAKTEEDAGLRERYGAYAQAEETLAARLRALLSRAMG